MRRRLVPAALALALLLSGCGSAASGGGQEAAGGGAAAANAQTGAETAVQSSIETSSGRTQTGSMELAYANQFSVDYYSDGSAEIGISGEDTRYLVLPEGGAAPADTDSGTAVLRRPLENFYVAASSAMDLFLQLGAMEDVRFTSTDENNWGIAEIRQALEDESLLYAGKYSAPDFELLVGEGCSLAVESTMIYHSPDIKEKLENLGIPVLVERSSYEPHPLGRVEWIKLYGLLTGREAEAQDFFDRQTELLTQLSQLPDQDTTVAFFHISTSGAAVVRRPGDYVSKMIELAGGKYIFSDLEGDDTAMSTMNMQMEAFYAGAKDADVLIYNSTIDGELDSIAQLLDKSGLLAEFKAVREGNVWCTEHDMFQKSSAAAGMIRDFNDIISGSASDKDRLTFFHRLK